MIELSLLVILGLVVGFFAGLLGIGGGAIMVPALTSYFLWQQYDPAVVVHMALATSMSCIIFTSILSIHTHQKHQAIIWNITAQVSPMVLLGSALASYFVIQINSRAIAIIFMCLMLLIAAQMLLDFKPQAKQPKALSRFKLMPAGFIIGWLSAMIAIGGGSLTVPFLNWYRIDIKKAIATAASVGLPIALASSMVFVMQGINNSQLPNGGMGYIYWPATLAISAGSLLTTPVGANLTHQLPVMLLKRVFALLIVLLAVRMYLTFD
ncbi:sulfite exporter TauE/SafE family protein [Marinicella sp. S1101]|uniref:sulfite exporter TauE/SafE family protein n=1 Tax=Marinicella marina TaxID=2996016 RepID=UPI002260E5DE|nr:sulfite exporter TauE/SafE family protein [Marinicella marina]MCX7553245.1 sulfite exporter TauE/SafE family protein [Marinicella marina]MDJ1138977.1 sulfite exporter TauE/SafE family protein [Marinicella marina]